MKKLKFLSVLLLGILSLSSFVFAAGTPDASQSEDEKLELARQQIAEDAAFIRQVNSDPKMTPDERKAAITEFMQKQNGKVR